MRDNDLKFIFLFFILILFARSCHTWGGTECRAHLYDQHHGGINWGWRVDCEHKGMTSVPTFAQDIKYIRTLNLSHNQILSLGGNTFTSLSSLTYVDLHHTQLRIINADTFKNLPRLRHLDLHDNKELTTIAKNSFAYLPNIQVIQLHDSGLTFVPEDIVNTRHHSLKVLSLGNNMFPCDCSISWLWKDYKDIYNILPRNLSGFHHTANTFKDHVGYIQDKFPPLTCYDPVNQQKHTFDDVDLSFCKDGYTGKWTSPWTSWIDCSCDTKTRYRHRECKNGEGVCPGPNTMYEVCSPTSCSNAGDWGEWSAWSLECTAECNGGIVNRTRPCIRAEKVITQELCEGAEEKGSETKSCNYHPCVYGIWSEWSSWLRCSSKCRNGVTSRIRTCLTSAPSKGGVRCIGHNRERRNCTVTCSEHFKKTLIDPFAEHKEQYNNIIRTARTWSQVLWTCILIQLFLMIIAVGSICLLYRNEMRTKNIIDTWDDIPDIIISSTSNSTPPITDSPESDSVNHLNIEYWIDIANECYMTQKDDRNQHGMESVEYSTVQLEHDKPNCVVDVQPVYEEVPEHVSSYCGIGEQDKGLEMDQNQAHLHEEVLEDEDTLESPPSNSHVIILPNRLQDGNMYSYEEQEQEDCMKRESLHRNSQHFLQQSEKQENQFYVDSDPHAITEKCSSEQLLETMLRYDHIPTDIENNQKMIRKQPSIDFFTSKKVDGQQNLGESIGYETHRTGKSMHHGPQYFLQPLRTAESLNYVDSDEKHGEGERMYRSPQHFQQPPQKQESTPILDSDKPVITEKDLNKHPSKSMFQDDHMRINTENTEKMSKDRPTIDTSAGDKVNYQQNLDEDILYEKHGEGERMYHSPQHFQQPPQKQESTPILDSDKPVTTEKDLNKHPSKSMFQDDHMRINTENTEKMSKDRPTIDTSAGNKVNYEQNLDEDIRYEKHGEGESMYRSPQHFQQPSQKQKSTPILDSEKRVITEKDLNKHPSKLMFQDDHMRINTENTEKMSKDRPTIDTSAGDKVNYEQNLDEDIRYEKHGEGESMYRSPQHFQQPLQKQESTTIVDSDARAITEKDLNKHPLKPMLQDKDEEWMHIPSKRFEGKLAQNESAESSLDQSSSTETLLGSHHSNDLLYADVKHLKVLVMGISPEKRIGLVQTNRGKMKCDCQSKNTAYINDEKGTDLKLLDRYILKRNNTQENIRDRQQHNFSVTETGDGQQKFHGSYERNQEKEVMHRQRFTQYQTPPQIDSSLTMKNNGRCVTNEKSLTNRSNASEFKEEHKCAGFAKNKTVIQKQQPYNSSVSHKMGCQEMSGENMQHHCSQNVPKLPQIGEDLAIVDNDVCAATKKDCTNRPCKAQFRDEYVSNDTKNTDRLTQLTDSSVNQRAIDEQNFSKVNTMDRYREKESKEHQSSQYFPKPRQIEEDPTIGDNDVCATNKKDFTTRSCNAQFVDKYVSNDTENTERCIQGQPSTGSSMNQRIDGQQSIGGNNTLELYKEVESTQHQSSQRFPRSPQIEEDPTIVDNDVCATTEGEFTNRFDQTNFGDEHVFKDSGNSHRILQEQAPTDSSVNQKVDNQLNVIGDNTLNIYGEMESTQYQSPQSFPKPPQTEEDSTIVDNDACATTERNCNNRSCKTLFRDKYVSNDTENTDGFIQKQQLTDSSVNQRVIDEQNFSKVNTIDRYREKESTEHQSSQYFPKPQQIEEDPTIGDNDVCATNKKDFTTRSCNAQFVDEYVSNDTENTERYIQGQPSTGSSMNQRVDDQQSIGGNNTLELYEEVKSTQHQSSQRFLRSPQIEEDPTIVDNDTCATTEGEFTNRFDQTNFGDEHVFKDSGNSHRILQEQAPTDSSVNQKVDNQLNVIGDNTLNIYGEMECTQYQSPQSVPKPPQTEEDSTIVDNDACATTERHCNNRSCKTLFRDKYVSNDTENTDGFIQKQPLTDSSVNQRVIDEQNFSKVNTIDRYREKESTEHQSSQYFPKPRQIEEDPTIGDNDVCATNEKDFTTGSCNVQFVDEYVSKDTENTGKCMQGQPSTCSSMNQRVDDQQSIGGNNTLELYEEVESTQHQSSQRFPRSPQIEEDPTIVNNGVCTTTEKYLCEDVYRYTKSSERLLQEQLPFDAGEKVDCKQDLRKNKNFGIHEKRECTQRQSLQYEEIENIQDQSSQGFSKPRQLEESSITVEYGACCISNDNELPIDSDYDNLDLSACNSSCVIDQLIGSSTNACIEKSTDSNLLVSEAHMKGSWNSFHGEDDHDAKASLESINNQDTTIFTKEKKKKKKRFKMLSKAVKATQRTFQRIRKSDKSKDENIKEKNSSSISMLSCVQSSTEMEDKGDKIYRRTSEEASRLFPSVGLEKEVDSALITGQTNSKKEEDCLISLEVLQNTVKQVVPSTALTSDKRKKLAESSLVNTTTVYQPITFAPLPAKLSTGKNHATTKDAQLFVDSNHRHKHSDVRHQTSVGKIGSSACDVMQHTRQSKSDSSCLF